MRGVVVGVGATGLRAARQMSNSQIFDEIVIVGRDLAATQRSADESFDENVKASNWRRELLDDANVLVLALPDNHRRYAEFALERSVPVVSCSDSVREVSSLLALDSEAIERGLTVIVGAAFAPGLSCILAKHVASEFTSVDEIHIAKFGTGGPACARQHHEALVRVAIDFRDGAWRRRRAGSGRELAYFPDPVGAHDCYRAEAPDALLLEPVFAGVNRITARLAATRRDRFTAHLPMLRKPHPEGTIGAIRVEVRGQRSGSHDVVTVGSIDRPGVAAGAVSGLTAIKLASRETQKPGVQGLASVVDEPAAWLSELAERGIKCAKFEGDPSAL